MSMMPNTYQQNRQAAVVTTVTDLLKSNMRAIQSCLPKHMTPERMCRIAVQTISKSRQLQQCSPQSLVAAIVEASSLGLEIDVRGQAYLVPYKSTVTLIPGYKGLMDLAYRSGRVANIYAETVCENDQFSFQLGLSPKLEHTPNLENRGDLRAVYAVARLKEADPVFVVLGKSEVEKVRKASKASGDGPWKTWEEEMWKKTAIRRLCKYLPLSPEMQRAVAIDEAADAGSPQHLAEAVIDLPPESFSGSTVEALSSALGEASAAKAEAVDVATEDAPEAQAAAPSDPQDEPTIPCPRKDGGLVSADDCFYCPERKGCPAREDTPSA